MLSYIGFAAVALVAAGFYFKKDETVAVLKSAYTWALAVGAAVAAQVGGYVDFTSFLN